MSSLPERRVTRPPPGLSLPSGTVESLHHRRRAFATDLRDDRRAGLGGVPRLRSIPWSAPSPAPLAPSSEGERPGSLQPGLGLSCVALATRGGKCSANGLDRRLPSWECHPRNVGGR